MNRVIAAALSGVLFGVGLALAQMIDPNKVLAFLDLAGAWDPSLILVMGGGAGVTALLFPWVMRRSRPQLDSRFHLPTKQRVDGRLISGAALFGGRLGDGRLLPGPCAGGAHARHGRAVAVRRRDDRRLAGVQDVARRRPLKTLRRRAPR